MSLVNVYPVMSGQMFDGVIYSCLGSVQSQRERDRIRGAFQSAGGERSRSIEAGDQDARQ